MLFVKRAITVLIVLFACSKRETPPPSHAAPQVTDTSPVVVKHGYARGTEPVAYVGSIMARWDNYKEFVKSELVPPAVTPVATPVATPSRRWHSP